MNQKSVRRILMIFSGAFFISVIPGKLWAEVKIGVVDMQKVILSVSEGKAARANLEKEIESKQKAMQKKKADLEKLKDQLMTQAKLLKDDAKEKKVAEFQQEVMKLQQDEMEFGQTIKQKEQEATQKIALKVAKFVETFAAEKKLDAVFETSTSGLLYAKDPVSLTEEVIQAYEKANPAPKSSVAKKE